MKKIMDRTTQHEDVSDNDRSTGTVMRPSMIMKKPARPVTTSSKSLSKRKPASICFHSVDVGNGMVGAVPKESASIMYEVVETQPAISKEGECQQKKNKIGDASFGHIPNVASSFHSWASAVARCMSRSGD
jgi:hypothetical protein